MKLIKARNSSYHKFLEHYPALNSSLISICISTLWLYDIAEFLRIYQMKHDSKKAELYNIIQSKNQNLAGEGLKLFTVVMTVQLVVMVAIEKSESFNLAYTLSSFISVFTLAYIPACFYLIQANLKIISGPKLLNSPKLP